MPVQITPNSKSLVIFDIDGCLIDSEERLPHLLAGDRETYHKLHPTDKVMHPGHAVYCALMNDDDLYFLFVTGREESAREFTLRQLQTLLGQRVQDRHLLMRPIGDETHDVELKPALIERAGFKLEDILVVFEDRDSTVKMWRERGITCYQTQPGSF